jgi:hypothetical protein
MAKDTNKPKVSIDGVEYDPETFSDEQRVILGHLLDLNRKLDSARFSFDQLTVGRDAFLKMLKESLADEAPKSPEEVN